VLDSCVVIVSSVRLMLSLVLSAVLFVGTFGLVGSFW
jgi:hypothetical protein